MLSQRLCHSEALLWLVKVAQPGWFPLSAVELRELLLVLAREAWGKHVSASWSSLAMRVRRGS